MRYLIIFEDYSLQQTNSLEKGDRDACATGYIDIVDTAHMKKLEAVPDLQDDSKDVWIDIESVRRDGEHEQE